MSGRLGSALLMAITAKIQDQLKLMQTLRLAGTRMMIGPRLGIQPPVKVGQFLAKGEYPPRLYHRTTNDSAFAILESGFQAGYGKSGKFHNYFAKATLAELDNKTGSRANLPIELVLCTEEVNNVAYLFETTSEGVLTRDCVPGSCVLYIRDTLKSTILCLPRRRRGRSSPT